jgi:DUF2934 family protein
MISHNPQKQPRPKKVIGPEKTPVQNELTMPSPLPSQDKVRARAYELFESRGRKPGQDKQDWFRAEQEILNRAGKQTTSTTVRASAGVLEN